MKKAKASLNCVYAATFVIILGALFIGNRAITVISENIPLERDICFVIDPGHGGMDGGATSCTGALESMLNLDISLRTRDLLRFLGHDTKMIRASDVSVYTEGNTISQKKVSDLKQRVRICNETENAVLLSIHQNYFSDGRYSGAQIFYAPTEGSKAMAEYMQQAFRVLNPESHRNAKQASGIYLLEHIQCKGILIECGFLSNPEEEAKLRSEEYQKKLSCVIAASAISALTEKSNT